MIGHGRSRAWAAAPLLAAAVALVLLLPSRALVARAPLPAAALAGPAPGDAEVRAVVLARCVACHSNKPRIAGFGAAPGGVNFDDPRALGRWADRIRVRVVETRTMPLGNMTGMTEEERLLIARWLAHGGTAGPAGPAR
jgi:uncharacterized membrane protein